MSDRSPCPELSPYVADALSALRADGVQPTDAEIAWLARLRERCDRPGMETMVANLGAAYQYGGWNFWPLHRRAINWFVRAGDICDPDLGGAIYMYAHLFSAPEDRGLDLQQDAASIEADVRAWLAEFPLHDNNKALFMRTLRMLDGFDADIVPTKTEPRPQNPMPGVAMLCRLFSGTTPEYWMSGISVKEIDHLMQANEPEQWATSQCRRAAVEQYQLAVKCIRSAHHVQ